MFELPAAVITDCQSVPATIVPLAPRAIVVPLIVIPVFANLSLAIVPGAICPLTIPAVGLICD